MIDVDYNEYKKTIAENMKLIVENHRLEEVEKEHQKLNGELREAIERLNNIINELKKDFESYELEYLQDTYQGSLADFIETELERIQELKGVDKE